MNVNQVIERGAGIVRHNVRLAERLTLRVVGDTYGLAQRVQHRRPPPKIGMDDVTLARKVETTLFRDDGALKSSINVNVVDGLVWLRGEVRRTDEIQTLEALTRAIPEVHGVENLLHLRKTPAPTAADTPRRQERTRSTTRRPTPRLTPGRVTDDRSDAIVDGAESSPAEHSEKGQGRTPAPFGSRNPGPVEGERWPRTDSEP